MPEGIERLVKEPGGLVTVGSSLLSVVLAGVALGVIGVLAVLGILILLVVIEIVREAARLRAERSELTKELEKVSGEAKAAPALRVRISDLKAEVSALEEEKQHPRAGFSETLEALAIHVNRMELTLKHRSMTDQVSTIPITRAAITEDGFAVVSGIAERGVDLLRGEPLIVVKDDGGVGLEPSEATEVDGSQVQARFGLPSLPGDLGNLIEQRGSLNPEGYALRLAGLCMAEYEAVADDDLAGMRDSIKEAIGALTRTLTEKPVASAEAGGRPTGQ